MNIAVPAGCVECTLSASASALAKRFSVNLEAPVLTSGAHAEFQYRATAVWGFEAPVEATTRPLRVAT